MKLIFFRLTLDLFPLLQNIFFKKKYLLTSKHRAGERSFTNGLLSKWPRVGQAGTRSQECSSDLPSEWQWPEYMGLLPPLPSGYQQGVQLEVGQLRHKLAPLWETSVAGSNCA